MKFPFGQDKENTGAHADRSERPWRGDAIPEKGNSKTIKFAAVGLSEKDAQAFWNEFNALSEAEKPIDMGTMFIDITPLIGTIQNKLAMILAKLTRNPNISVTVIATEEQVQKYSVDRNSWNLERVRVVPANR